MRSYRDSGTVAGTGSGPKETNKSTNNRSSLLLHNCCWSFSGSTVQADECQMSAQKMILASLCGQPPLSMLKIIMPRVKTVDRLTNPNR